MLIAVSVLARVASVLYFAFMLIRWISIVGTLPSETMQLSFFDPIVNAIVVSFGLWAVGVIAGAVDEVLQDSRNTRIVMRDLYEERLADSPTRPRRDMWQEPPSQGQVWRNKFRGWRPEKTPITFDGDEYDPPPRAIRKYNR